MLEFAGVEFWVVPVCPARVGESGHHGSWRLARWGVLGGGGFVAAVGLTDGGGRGKKKRIAVSFFLFSPNAGRERWQGRAGQFVDCQWGLERCRRGRQSK